MTTPIDPVERRLPGELADLAAARTPEYLIDILGQTARTRQRPAWTFPERWLPMVEIARQPIRMQRLPLRPIVILAMVGLLIAASLTLYLGSRPHLPPAFGPARNGLIAYAAAGTVYTADPVTGAATAIATGEMAAVDPVWSQDGTRLLFERKVKGRYGGLVFSVRADGSDLIQLTPDVLADIWGYQESSIDRAVFIGHIVGGTEAAGSLSVAGGDGSAIRTLDLGIDVWGFGGMRPGASDLLVIGAAVRAGPPGMYLAAPDGTRLRTLIEPVPDVDFGDAPVWSPDGTRIAYSRWEQGATQLRVHVMNADGTGDHIVGHKDGAWFEGQPSWSPDGTRLLIHRDEGKVGEFGGATPTIISVDGSTPELQIAYSTPPNGDNQAWSPDGTKIQVTPFDDDGDPQQQLLWDTTTGASTTAPWNATSRPTWQRLAP